MGLALELGGGSEGGTGREEAEDGACEDTCRRGNEKGTKVDESDVIRPGTVGET